MEPGVTDSEVRQLLSFAVVGGGVGLRGRRRRAGAASVSALTPAKQACARGSHGQTGDTSRPGSSLQANVRADAAPPGRAPRRPRAHVRHPRGALRSFFSRWAVFDFINEDVGKYFPRLKGVAQITLFEGSDKILGSFDESLSRFAARRFTRQGIIVRTGKRSATRRWHDTSASRNRGWRAWAVAARRGLTGVPGVPVQRVDSEAITLSNGERHPFGLLVWSTGIGPNALVNTLPVAKERGKVS